MFIEELYRVGYIFWLVVGFWNVLVDDWIWYSKGWFESEFWEIGWVKNYFYKVWFFVCYID